MKTEKNGNNTLIKINEKKMCMLVSFGTVKKKKTPLVNLKKNPLRAILSIQEEVFEGRGRMF